ncbi:MAG: two-component sensor histidine kinase, partial [Chloroflexota bacterium]|nr:two-component sensor histidine kinase [Chloroflexota bacterium]
DNGQRSGSAQQHAEEHGGHHGLQGMRERASALYGNLSAEAQTGGGFTVLLTLPLNKKSRTDFPQEVKRERS